MGNDGTAVTESKEKRAHRLVIEALEQRVKKGNVLKVFRRSSPENPLFGEYRPSELAGHFKVRNYGHEFVVPYDDLDHFSILSSKCVKPE
jgi:hypothetical protein